MANNRKPTGEQSHVVNLAVPVDLDTIDISKLPDCFSYLYNPEEKSCVVCHDSELCSIATFEKVKKKQKKVEEGKNIIQDIDFTFLNKRKSEIEKVLVNKATKGEPMTTKDLVAWIKKKANTIDDVAVIEWLKDFIKGSEKVKTKDGFVILR
jgi:hypothetical protein